MKTRRTLAAIGAVLAAVVVAGCDADPGPPHTTEAASAPSGSAPAEAGPQVIDVAALPVGAPPRADHLAGGTLHWHGRSVPTDFPADAVGPVILGDVDGLAVVTAYAVDGPSSGDRFWAVDASGHAQRLGGTYESYDYFPRLVEETGHIWVHHDNRTTARTMWELDARTGEEIAVYAHSQVPHGLAPADQALVDAWVARRDDVPETEARTVDGSLVAKTRSVQLGQKWADAVVVRQSADRGRVARFTFPENREGGVERVVFEDSEHILVLVTDSYTRRLGSQQVIVRCSVLDGSCERTTDIGGNMALGVVRPLFEEPRSRG